MRRNRRNSHIGLEFGGSGEDSFVAVVVTKLTGALLFILLLTMVIMALIPKAVDLPADAGRPEAEKDAEKLEIATPNSLPEAIAGRPYALAFAARGARGPLNWALAGELPEGLRLDSETGILRGTPARGTPRAVELVVRVSDGASQDARPVTLLVYQSDTPLATPSWWKPGLPPVPWKSWLEQGFGFVVLGLVHLVGMNSVAGVRRRTLDAMSEFDDGDPTAAERRFAIYRLTLRLATLTAFLILGVWLWRHRT
jgi:hypothetical protein